MNQRIHIFLNHIQEQCTMSRSVVDQFMGCANGRSTSQIVVIVPGSPQARRQCPQLRRSSSKLDALNVAACRSSAQLVTSPRQASKGLVPSEPQSSLGPRKGSKGLVLPVQALLSEVACNPKDGLPRLLGALQESHKEVNHQALKGIVPVVFDLLPKAIQSIGDAPKPLMNACAVIEYCVEFCNDPMICDCTLSINPKKCQGVLALQFNQIASTARKRFHISLEDDVVSSRKITAIALASCALFQLKYGEGQVCAGVLTNAGCVEASLSALDDSSGLEKKAKVAIASMLSSLLDTGNEKATHILTSRQWLPTTKCRLRFPSQSTTASEVDACHGISGAGMESLSDSSNSSSSPSSSPSSSSTSTEGREPSLGVPQPSPSSMTLY